MSHIFICQVREKRAVLKHTTGSIWKKTKFSFLEGPGPSVPKTATARHLQHPPPKTNKKKRDSELHVFTFTVLLFLFPGRDQKDKTFLSKLVAL